MPSENLIAESNKIPQLKIEALLIICQEPGAVCGRLRSLDEGKIEFSIHNNAPIADRFSAGFRCGNEFILFDELEKSREDSGSRGRTIQARIRAISNDDKSALQRLLARRWGWTDFFKPEYAGRLTADSQSTIGDEKNTTDRG